MDEFKASVFQAVEELQQSMSNMHTDPVEPVNIDPHTKMVLLSQQVIHEMENRNLLMYSNIFDSLHEIIKILVKDEDGSSQLNGSCFQYFIDSNFMGQLLHLSGSDSPTGYRNMVFEVATILVSVMDSKLLLNDEFGKSIQVLLNEPIKLEAKKPIAFPYLTIYVNLVSPTNTVHLDDESGELSRQSFLLLARFCKDLKLEQYLIQTNFPKYLISTLSGLLSQLPHVVPELLTLSSEDRLGSIVAFESDFGLLLQYLDFFQSILVDLESRLLCDDIRTEFQEVFLEKVLAELIHTCNKDDGSVNTILYYLQHILDHLREQETMVMFIHFVMARASIPSPVLDLIFAKFEGFTDRTKIQAISLVISMVQKYPPAVRLLFENLVDSSHPKNVVEKLELIRKYERLDIGELTIANSALESYMIDATNLLQQPLMQPYFVKSPQGFSTAAETERIKTSPYLSRLFSLLGNLFEQSFAWNLAVTGLLTTLLLNPNDILFDAITKIGDDNHSISLYSVLDNLIRCSQNYKQKIPSFNLKISWLRSQIMDDVYPDFVVGVSHEEECILRTMIVVNEFRREVLSAMLIRGGIDINES